MSRELKAMAEVIASRFYGKQDDLDWEDVRDIADLQSGGDLHPVQLDILTDMIIKRVKEARK